MKDRETKLAIMALWFSVVCTTAYLVGLFVLLEVMR